VKSVTIARNYDREQPDSVLQDFEDTIFNQDRVVVESQRPERVPFDLAGMFEFGGHSASPALPLSPVTGQPVSWEEEGAEEPGGHGHHGPHHR